MYVIRGRVIDGNGGPPIEKGAVVVEGNRIVQVCSQNALQIPRDVQVIEIENGSILPGLIDQHVHIGMGGLPKSNASLSHVVSDRIFTNPYETTCQALSGLKDCLYQGFTSVRDCGGIGGYLKDAWEAGTFEGPRIASSGCRGITQTGGHGDRMKGLYTQGIPKNVYPFTGFTADGADEVRYMTRYTLSQNADFVKMTTSSGVTGRNKNLNRQEFTEPEVRAAVEEAENFGTYVSSHCVSNSGIRLAAKCGVKSIEHASFLDEEAADLMAEKNCIMIPTFAVAWIALENIDKMPPLTARKFMAGNHAHTTTFRYALERKIPIGYGTDLAPGAHHGKEFECLYKLGMTPGELITAATKTGAELMCCSEIGTLEPGKLADIILVKGNPLEDILLLCDQKNIPVVIQDGKIVKNHCQT